MTNPLIIPSSNKSSLRASLVVSTLLTLMIVAIPANAASHCKGLEANACSTTAACGWVNGYERKDGRKVSSFCRMSQKGNASKKASNRSASKSFKTAKQSERCLLREIFEKLS